MIGAFAALALLLAAVGIYGVVAYTVTRRTREIGIRMALGAKQGQILRAVIQQAMVLTAVGIVIGCIGAIGAGRLLSSGLYQIRASDPLTFLAVILVLTAVSLAACWIAGRRAAGVDPLTALRYE